MKILISIGSWIKDHLLLVLLFGVFATLFVFVNYDAELIYSAAKFIAVVFLASLVLHLAFPHTIHKYINEGQLMTDFAALDSKHKVWAVIVVIGVLFLVSAICFVHA